MADTRELLSRIASFRAKLESAVPMAEVPAAVPMPTAEPVVLTERAQKLLLLTRDSIAKQKQIAQQPILANPLDSLSIYHKATVSLTEAALKLAQQLPANPAEQLEACDGIENFLRMIEQRNQSLQSALSIRTKNTQRLDKLTGYLTAMLSGQRLILNPLVDLANELLEDSKHNPRLQLIEPLDAAGPQRSCLHYVAAHGLNAAAIIARLLPHDFEWATKPVLPVLAAMVMDVGLINLANDAVFADRPLTASERTAIELHPRRSADMIRQLLAESGPLADIVLAHHEKPDGSGYPNGLRGDQLPTLARFLSTADTYAALITSRPHRDPIDTRAALTEILSLAEQGKLDRDFAEYQLNLSFHPVGTVVELVDGRLAVVAANAALKTGNKPVVAVLTDAQGQVRMRPEFLDLATAERGGVLRSVPKKESRAKLREWYPELCV